MLPTLIQQDLNSYIIQSTNLKLSFQLTMITISKTVTPIVFIIQKAKQPILLIITILAITKEICFQ